MAPEGGNDSAGSPTCDDCGATVGPDDNFCTTCGAALGGADSDEAASEWQWGLASESDQRERQEDTVHDDPANPDGPDDPAPPSDDDLPDWQKRCPACEAVLVAQAVRCTNCGATQPDASAPAGTTGDPATGVHGAGVRDGARPDTEASTEKWPHADSRADPTRTTTDAGKGEVQYERERARDRTVEHQRDGRPGDDPARAPGAEHEVSAAPEATRQRRRTRRSAHWIEDIGRDPPEGGWGGKFAEPKTRGKTVEQGARPFEPEPPNENWWLGVLLPAGLTLLGAFVGVSQQPDLLAQGFLPWTGDAYGVFEVAAALTPTLAPLALYLDRKFVHQTTGWLPSKAFFLVVVPYLNILVTALYLWKRDQYVDTL
ncbi:hypothetical protein [Haloarchaeobius sp. TZWSO28]|uniref:hypothetical protein n=1 Tax=Haloarchaeobius sp. TZWSO28 TaxID=3446119 RepID=UPI003EBAEBBF